MEVRKLQVAENLNEKQHVWCEGNKEGRSYSNTDNEAHLSRKEETQDNIAYFSPQVHFQTISPAKLLRVSQCKETATSVKHGRYTNITDILI